MPNGFDELLSAISDPNDKAALQSLGDKIPALKESVLRQSDYSRKLNEFQQKEATFKDAEERLQNWESWRSDNWLDEHNMTRPQWEAQQELERMNRLIQPNSQPQGDEIEMTPEELNAQLETLISQKGFLTQSQVDAQLAAKEAEFNNRLTTNATNQAMLSTLTQQYGLRHYQKFGEVLDTNDLFDKANKAGIQNFEQAYEMYTAPKVRELEQQAHAKEIEEAKAAGYNEGRQQSTMGQDGRMPVDMGVPEMGYLQKQFAGIKSPEGSSPIPENLTVENDGALGLAVAAKYRADQMQSA